jgi:ubiquitin carboxyl-terminal hydrolase 34
MQQLFMISEARECILRSNVVKSSSKNQNKTLSYEKMLTELKRMFAYLQESERKAYNPKDFCKVYIMDQQPLTAEYSPITIELVDKQVTPNMALFK